MMTEKKIPDFQILFILAFIQFVHILDFVLMMPLGPILQKKFAISAKEFSHLVSSYTFSAAIIGLIGALFLDRFDRKYSLVILFLGFVFGTFMCGLSDSYSTLLTARVITGGFGGVLSAVVMSIVGDVFPPEKRGRATGVVMSSFSVASLVGVPIGILGADKLGWNKPFLILAAISLLMIPVSYISIPNVKKHLQNMKPIDTIFKTFLENLRNPAHIPCYFLIVFVVMSGFSVIPYIAIYMSKNVQVAQTNITWVYFFGGLFTFFTARIFGILTDKFGAYRTFVTLALVSILPILVLTNLPVLPLPLVLLCSTIFMIFVSGRFIPGMTLMNSAVRPEVRGGYMSISGFFQQLASGVAAMSGGRIIDELPNGNLVHYDLVGLFSIAFIFFAIYAASKIKSIS